MFFRRNKKNAGRNSNRSPHVKNPKVGIYPTHGDSEESFPCLKCTVAIEVFPQKVNYLIESHFTALYPVFDVFFPVSECGNVSEFASYVNGVHLKGDLYREKDGRYLLSTDPGFDDEDGKGDEEEVVPPKKVAPKLTKGKPERKPPVIYYYYVKGASRQISPDKEIKRGTRLEMKVAVKTVGFLREKVLNVPFPLVTCPRSPDEFSYKIDMVENIRRISSPNKSHAILPYVNGKSATVNLDVGPQARIRMDDYMFVLQVELGEPITPQCADPISLLVLITAIAGMVFLTLTRDLEDF
jgi:hypothetical protein